MKGETEVRDILYTAESDDHKNDYVFEKMTISEFKNLYTILRNYSANQIGVALNKIGIIAKRGYREKKQERLAVLPRPKNRINAEDFKPKI